METFCKKDHRAFFAKPDWLTEVAKPDVAKPDVVKLDVVKPDVAKPDSLILLSLFAELFC